MTGTEKQIKWAEDIKAAVLDEAEQKLKMFQNFPNNEFRPADIENRIKAARRVANLVSKKDDAAWFINGGNGRSFMSLWRKQLEALNNA